MIPPPLSLYVHFPYCVKKCPYCDFASRASRDIPQEGYLTALLRELEQWRRFMTEDDRPLISIFFGGGTPSLFDPEKIALFLRQVGHLWPLTQDCEISLEANPESVTPDRLLGYRQAGVNRLSLGIQSLRPERLQQLHRPHDVATALAAIQSGKNSGFNSFSMDLIYATPGQTLEQWAMELALALSFQPDHLSCYTLTLEEGTPFYQAYQQGNLNPVDDETELALFRHTRTWLTAQGMAAYEISNFCRPGQECRHNVNYWQFGDYLGVGAAAHGKITNQQGQTRRTTNISNDERYIASLTRGDSCQSDNQLLSNEDTAAEWLIMGLRQQRGVDLDRYTQLAGESLWHRRGKELERFLADGLLQQSENRLFLTEEGVRLANLLLSRLI